MGIILGINFHYLRGITNIAAKGIKMISAGPQDWQIATTQGDRDQSQSAILFDTIFDTNLILTCYNIFVILGPDRDQC